MRTYDDGQAVIGFDIGGTTIKSGVVSSDGRLLYVHKTATPKDSMQLLESISTVFYDLAGKVKAMSYSLVGVGLAVPGWIDRSEGRVIQAANLKLYDFPLRQLIAARLGVPTEVINDSNAAALGEYEFGGYGFNSFISITLGTGIGAGIIVDGRLYEGPSGRAGEIGHIRLSENGPTCNCGRTGCLECYASGWGIVRETWRNLSNGRDHSNTTGFYVNKSNISVEDVVEAANAGDVTSMRVLKNAAYQLGLTISNAVMLLDIRNFILAGGIMKMKWPFLENVLATLECPKPASRVLHLNVVVSRLIDRAAIFGASALVYRKYGQR
ncbi:MAG: ROK family protein [Alicyclobacillus sp.]|nr:ROK family protein [Alicyclobacillus sp.]